MRISEVRTEILSCPLAEPVPWPYGVWEGVSVVLVELHTDEGLIGYGESGVYQPPAEATENVIQGIAHLLVGEDPFDSERIALKLRQYGGWGYAPRFGFRALAGVDTALWDLMGKAVQLPVYKLLGGRVRDRIGFMRFVTEASPEAMAAQAKDAVAAGHRTLYLKYTTVEKLVAALEAIRTAVLEEPNIRIDFNQTLSPGAAVRIIRQLEPFGIEYIEQPVLESDVEGLAYVRRSVAVPIASDESTHTLGGLHRVIHAGAADIIGIDPRGLGSLWDAKRAAGIAAAAGLPTVARAATELGLGQALFLHYIVSTPSMVYDNQTAYHLVLANDYLPPGTLQFVDGAMAVPEGPGLGVEPDPERVASYHEHYRRHGGYSNFGVSPELAPTLAVRPLPFY